MPQLDKYIFFNHVVTLSVFFFLVYVYLRGSVIPYISSTLKYRKKRVNLFTNELENYTKTYDSTKIGFETISKNFNIKNFETLDKLTNFYNIKSFEELFKLYSKGFNLLKKIFNFYICV